MVKAGKLPAVDQRLPAAPRALTLIEEVGQYGGVWRTGMRGGGDKSWLLRTVGYEPLVAWDREWTGNVVPNVAESFAVNPAGDEFTLKLRRGMKWSDGKPIRFSFPVVGVVGDSVKPLELVREYWNAIGIDMQLQRTAGGLIPFPDRYANLVVPAQAGTQRFSRTTTYYCLFEVEME